MGWDYRGLFEGWELGVAKKLISEFRSRWRSLQHDEFDDLMQECLVHWISVRGEFDPSRETTRTAFMARVLRNKLMDLVRERESDKRKANYESISLDQPIGDEEDSSSLLDIVDATQVREKEEPGRVLGDEARVDLVRAIERLTPHQRQLCQLLGDEGLTVQEVSRKLGIPRATIYDELKRIRMAFAELGLKDYLKR